MADEERTIAIAARQARDSEASRPELVDSACFTSSSIFPESPALGFGINVAPSAMSYACTRASARASLISAGPAPVNKL